MYQPHGYLKPRPSSLVDNLWINVVDLWINSVDNPVDKVAFGGGGGVTYI
tara:strand:+ start:1398 stop:1547 length:150 start_codon:yes stop_codon:yes gene_type:complete